MTDVRTFQAASMQEALAVVTREMGDEAVILHTRQSARRRWLPWPSRRTHVEITAGLGMNVPTLASRSAEASADSSASAPTFSRAAAAVAGEPAADVPAAPGLDLTTPDDVESCGEPQSRETAPSIDSGDPLATQLAAIRRMLESLTTTGGPGRTSEVPAELFDVYAELIDADVDDTLARDLIFKLKRAGSAEQLADPAAARALLTALVESEVSVGGPIELSSGSRKVVALVGSTGVGKTTTIAKLAANFRLREGVRMGLVTVDTYRIAAVEQLRTYAEIIDLPMKVVTSPLEMRRAMDELLGLDLVMIDTAGRSPRDELQIQELKRLLAEAGVDEVHLVLSLTSSLKGLLATVEKFEAVGTTSLILTKLDEAAAMGTLLSLARQVKLPVSYLTTGQDVPDDIEPAHAARMTRLVLGKDTIG